MSTQELDHTAWLNLVTTALDLYHAHQYTQVSTLILDAICTTFYVPLYAEMWLSAILAGSLSNAEQAKGQRDYALAAYRYIRSSVAVGVDEEFDVKMDSFRAFVGSMTMRSTQAS